MSVPRMGELHPEHVLLGARFEAADEAGGLLRVASYEREEDVCAALAEGALLCDFSGAAYLLAHGQDASLFAEAALAGRSLAVGEAAFEAVLAGDGGLVGAPLALRTGDTEFVLVDASARAGLVAPWLGSLCALELEGERLFPSVALEDATTMLTPLLLAGARARQVLEDYVSAPGELPHAGRVASTRLDAIAAVVACLPVAGASEAFCLLVPPASARVLWRSLLSFTEVSPVGHEALRSLVASEFAWGALIGRTDAVRATRAELARWGLLRPGGGHVGERGLDAETG